MKKHDAALERVLAWAGEARGAQSRFDLPPDLRASTLRLWKRGAANNGEDSLLRFLKWAVAGSVAVMVISILFNFHVFQAAETTAMDGSPQKVFQAQTSVTFYVP